ncbi:hypothetical protein TBLA_0F02120 [Henningerozyma blattae CBS 6284]|uniref:ditrans,polycis-polyprenyl diphosphate synthase [(2E,6E)-farnesyldiphosphate specific] n=1 Tax=Henningerozyma blattae (strain ATCC 34711 / CBS 6284 / DSM 70876 / NBRC 10599 / NRRL Y-10934 / UCD 77-7) TaxID=1071380 RepID=I2H5V2_HENB6|nr:hypothetical protein TBLA_0F02120 [Tetrapisispora blattae CBS 6284]CCH61754.1 hypothetical protein TBLA_0F02120 [Tetrapisispora blattae CBS 6284]
MEMEEIQELVYADIRKPKQHFKSDAVDEVIESEGSTLVARDSSNSSSDGSLRNRSLSPSKEMTPEMTTNMKSSDHMDTTDISNQCNGKSQKDATMEKEARIHDKILEKSQIPYGKMQYSLYSGLLVVLSIVFVICRAINYMLNKLRLKISDILNTHSHSPQIIKHDIKSLDKKPTRLGAILNKKSISEINGGINGLLNDASELICWTVASEIPTIILYDYNGQLKNHLMELKNEIYVKLTEYFGKGASENIPNYSIKIPHSNKTIYYDESNKSNSCIEIILLSSIDGKGTIVDLTKTMSQLYHSNDLNINDITVDLVQNELTQLVGPEPDLLLIFSPSLDFQDFPPWHLRLTEFYFEQDNDQVTYSTFRNGLRKYAGCKVNIGR